MYTSEHGRHLLLLPGGCPNCPDSPRVEWKEAEQLVWSPVAASALLATWQRRSSAYEAADTLSHAAFLSTPVAQSSIKPLITFLPLFILFSLFPFFLQDAKGGWSGDWGCFRGIQDSGQTASCFPYHYFSFLSTTILKNLCQECV